MQFEVHGKFPNDQLKNATYMCRDTDDLHDAIFMITTGGGEVTWVGEKTYIGTLPNGGRMYEYKKIEGAYA